MITINKGFTTDYIPIANRTYYYRARACLVKNNIPLYCSICRITELLEAHHIDENITNNDINNLMWLCRDCHEKLHGIKRY